VNGTGIPFVYVGRLVRYRESDVAAYIDALPTHRSTSEAKPSTNDRPGYGVSHEGQPAAASGPKAPPGRPESKRRPIQQKRRPSRTSPNAASELLAAE